MERYVIRELTGFSAGTGNSSRAATDVMVLDTDYSYAVVAYYSSKFQRAGVGNAMLDQRRRDARVACRRLNVLHARWLREGATA